LARTMWWGVMAGIFISYRREDTAPWAGRIYERLAHEFSRNQLFMDVDNIAPGLDFVEVLEEQIAACDALLVLIGRDWVEAKNVSGQRRLDDPNDFVRVEVEAALRRNVRVIPILVDGARMPAHEDLPECLRPLLRRNAVELTHARFGTDVKRLTDALAPLIKKVDATASLGPHQTDPAVQLLDGVVFERAALEHWESIKGTTDPKRFVEFLAGYGKSRMGRLAHDALQRLATPAWRKVNKDSESGVTSFIESYPGTEEIAVASAIKTALQAWREQVRAPAITEPSRNDPTLTEVVGEARTRAHWANWLLWASFCFVLLVGAVALILAVPSLRPTLPPNPTSPAAQPRGDRVPATIVPAQSLPGKSTSEPPPTETSDRPSGSEGERPPRPSVVRPPAPLPPGARPRGNPKEDWVPRTEPLSYTKQ